jgi:DNA-binding NarL/FixJ family response regulator
MMTEGKISNTPSCLPAVDDAVLAKIFPCTVCCSNESPQYMLQCLDVGAADYLIKPLCQDVIKTLFLVSLLEKGIFHKSVHFLTPYILTLEYPPLPR